MPPPLLLDFDRVDCDRVLLDRNQIYEYLPHRYEFMLLDAVCHLDAENLEIVSYCDVKAEDWWFRGHVPGRPLLPGVLMLEMAAHTSAVLARQARGITDFIAYGGVDRCKFREVVEPGMRIYFLVKGRDLRARRIVTEAQGVLDGRIAFEAVVTGLMLKDRNGA